MAKRIFEVAVLLEERVDADGVTQEEARLIVEPKYVLAANEEQVKLQVTKEIPDDVLDDADKIERLRVAVRPF